MGHIFISYSRQDKQFVDGLIRDIEESGFSVWVDRADIRGGSQWRAAITQAIRDCDAFLVILSPNCTESKNVGRELELAADRSRPILPIIYQVCEIPPEIEYHFAGVQRIDFSDQGASEAAFDQLVDGLKGMAGAGPQQRKPSPPPKPEPQSQPTPQRQPAPAWPPAAFAAQPVPAPSLLQLMPGRWNVQITHPLVGTANATFILAPNGFFEGQLIKPPMVMTTLQGQWQATPMNQIILQGQETNGFQVGPYGAVIQINQIANNQLSGMTSAGEQVLWQKVL